MSSGSTILRLVRLRALGSETALDVRLRDAVLPALASGPGVVEAWAGRRRTPEGDERCLVVIARHPDPHADLVGDPPNLAALDPALPRTELLGSIVLPLAVEVAAERDEAARVLRVVEGRTRPGELAAYLGRVEAGAIGDVARSRGPLRLCLAADGRDRFVTVSTWADWGDIETSTGSDARRPNVTRHLELLEAAEVAHYEVLPGRCR